MHVLAVEDRIKNVSLLRRGLEETGMTVDCVSGGEDAVLKAESCPYDLILMDVELPQKDGLMVITKLRKKNQTPILCLAAKDTMDDIVTSFDAGCDGYMTKPFAFAELVTRMRVLVCRSKQKRGADICFAELRLDPVNLKVWRNEEEIDLSSKECSLLIFFINHPNQMLSQVMISAHVWGIVKSSEGMVDCYVNSLRKKIDTIPDKKIFYTIRGVGYIFRLDELNYKK
ncbi:MAG: response regulator transcription factor [Desulfuromusa sp.]|nr:response regulator transcription factor [Desulfuromusa sp.]